MELWIRSQDKMNLVKINQVSINYQDNKQIIANYVPELYENSSCYYELLGTYSTKERALEVLDEIGNILMPKFILDTTSLKPSSDIYKENGYIFQNYSGNVEIQQLNNYVYEMPDK